MNNEMESILSDLKSSDSDTRELALDKIGERKPENALDLILPVLLSDPDEEVRATAAFNLGEISDDRTVPYLLQVIDKESSKSVREGAIRALENYLGGEIHQCLIRESQRKEQSRIAKLSIIKQLSRYEEESSVDALLVWLFDWDVFLRHAAAEVLYKLNRPRLRESWKKALKDRSYIVRGFARKSLAELKSIKE